MQQGPKMINNIGRNDDRKIVFVAYAYSNGQS